MKFRIVVFLLALPCFAHAATAALTTVDERFLAARDAAHAGDRARLERFAPDLKGHELAPYVEYWQLQLVLENADRSQSLLLAASMMAA